MDTSNYRGNEMPDFTGMDFADVREWLDTQSEDSLAADIYLLWNQLRTAQEELAAARAEVARLREVVSMCLKVLRAIPVHEGYSAVDKAIICSEVKEAALSPDSGEWVAVGREDLIIVLSSMETIWRAAKLDANTIPNFGRLKAALEKVDE